MEILETFCKGKSIQSPCEDAYVITDSYVAVIDGVTSKSDFILNGKTTGKLAADTISSIIEKLPPKSSSLFLFSFNLSNRVLMYSPLSPQQIKPQEGKGHPMQVSDLLQTGLSSCCGGLANFRNSGPYHHLGLAIFYPVPFLFVPHDSFTPINPQNKYFLKIKKAGASESLALPDTPACPIYKLVTF